VTYGDSVKWFKLAIRETCFIVGVDGRCWNSLRYYGYKYQTLTLAGLTKKGNYQKTIGEPIGLIRGSKNHA
jgi:hypothetical protein